jgi:BirA family biotin operon repressor/biotin-[acetyl-CoA-carboxylase] ligase
VVVGVGINVKKQEFFGELVDKASDLETECGQEMDRTRLLSSIMNFFEKDFEQFVMCGDLEPFSEFYHAHLLNMNAQVRVLDPKEPFEGVARGITPTGELLVEREDGQVVQVYAGEVSVRGLQGYV